MRGLAKFVTLALGVGALIVLMIPPALYVYTTRTMIDEVPIKESNKLGDNDVLEEWKSIEKCLPEDCASITPYWIYRWAAMAIINDSINPLDSFNAYANVSKMAGAVAIHWMRSGHFKGQGMGWWHLTHALLGIYIQRNWKANEIVLSYKAINT